MDTAKERAANLVLATGLALDAGVLGIALWPGLPSDAELMARLGLVPAPVAWGFYVLLAVFIAGQVHYLMRFVWGEGHWPVLS